MKKDPADIEIRTADISDLHGLSAIRGTDVESRHFWAQRIAGYLNGTHHPQLAMPDRTILVAEHQGRLIGWIAGHLTTRYNCQGELQWLDVQPEFRSFGIASALLAKLAAWFGQKNADRICVNCAADNVIALAFYRKHGAQQLNDHWLVWPDIERSVTTTTAPGRS